MIKIQATISGYGGTPCTVFSAYSTESDVLAISVEAAYRRERQDTDCLVITNEPTISRDRLFSEPDIMASISAFYSLSAGLAADGKSPRIVFSDRAARTHPVHAIEKDGISEAGQKYRVSADVTCAQMAVLATCPYVSELSGINAAVEMAQSLADMAYFSVMTI